MPFKALNKKTLGRENQMYLFLSFIYTCLLMVFVLGLSCFEFFDLKKYLAKNKKEEATTLMINMLHSIGFAILLIPLSVMYYRWMCAKQKVTIYSPLIPVTHFLIVVVYLYNPWIIEYRNKAHRYFVLKSITSLSFYVIFIFPFTLILWRMSKVEPDYDGDEPYLVIYGGEGSETKKLLDDSE